MPRTRHDENSKIALVGPNRGFAYNFLPLEDNRSSQQNGAQEKEDQRLEQLKM